MKTWVERDEGLVGMDAKLLVGSTTKKIDVNFLATKAQWRKKCELTDLLFQMVARWMNENRGCRD
jgi:hypothetical protein